jgi:hypothetical protein
LLETGTAKDVFLFVFLSVLGVLLEVVLFLLGSIGPGLAAQKVEVDQIGLWSPLGSIALEIVDDYLMGLIGVLLLFAHLLIIANQIIEI